MSPWLRYDLVQPQRGNLFHFYYNLCKPEPLVKEFNMIALFLTGALISLGIQRGKDGMKSSWYHLGLGATAACNKRYWWRRQRGWVRGPWKVKQCIVSCSTVSSSQINKKRQLPPLVFILLLWWKQHQRILQGKDRGVNEWLAWRILHSVEYQAYVARGKAANC